MSQQSKDLIYQQEGRIDLALQGFQSGQFETIRRAAAAFDVPHQRLSDRLHGICFRHRKRANGHKLTSSDEHTIIQYILDLDARGFAPRLSEVADMADKLLTARGKEPVGKNWTERFISRSDELNMAFNRAKDRQRILQEDSEVVSARFTLVSKTITEFGVYKDDIHNFDETGFQMGVIGTMKVVTGSERRTRPQLVQPGDREWVTVTQAICSAGYATPPFIIYKGRVHISAWYEEVDIPHSWKLAVSENGWTNNELGLEWLKHFDAFTTARQVGRYWLLILDDHESHVTQNFKDYCLEQKILTLCMPAHSSHIL
jgi:hypothetical protein